MQRELELVLIHVDCFLKLPLRPIRRHVKESVPAGNTTGAVCGVDTCYDIGLRDDLVCLLLQNVGDQLYRITIDSCWASSRPQHPSIFSFDCKHHALTFSHLGSRFLFPAATQLPCPSPA